MKKAIAFGLSLLMVLVLFCSCGNETSENFGGNQTKPSEDTPSSVSMDFVSTEDSVEKKIIKTYRLDLETLSFGNASDLIVSAAESLGGYISESSEKNTSITEDSKAFKYATYTVRIPADKVEEYLETIETECSVLRSSLTTEDITDSYYDYQAQLDSLRLQEERLTAMLEQADTLDYMITLEDKLTQIRAEINSIHSKLQLMDKSVNYSYVYLTLSEVREYTPASEGSYWQRIGNAFSGAIVVFTNVISEIFIGIVWILPFLILGTVIAVIIISAKRKKKKHRMNQNKDENIGSFDTEEKK